MPKYFYDTEFLDTGTAIDLVSIGVVCEDGRELYLQSSEFNPKKASQWVWDNVFPHLSVCPYINHRHASRLDAQLPNELRQHKYGQCIPTMNEPVRHRCLWRTRSQIRQELLWFMDVEKYGKPELIAYYADYDHIAFCQLFGTMVDLPSGFPMYTFDIKQLHDELGQPMLPSQDETEHNALHDARHNKVMYDFLMEFKRLYPLVWNT